MTETEKILLDTLKTIEKDRTEYDKNVMASLVQLAERVVKLEKLTEQVEQLSEQNRVLTEQLQRLTSLSKR